MLQQIQAAGCLVSLLLTYPVDPIEHPLLTSLPPPVPAFQPPTPAGLPCKQWSLGSQFKKATHNYHTLKIRKENRTQGTPTQQRQTQKWEPRPIITPNTDA